MGIMRIDDVSANTDLIDFKKQVEILRKYNFQLLVGINLFCKSSTNGSLYPDLPLSSKPYEYLLDVDSILIGPGILSFIKHDEIVSHGLIHVNHRDISKETQEMSIVASCSILNTKKFIPPFNAVNEDTFKICEKHGIEVIGNKHDREWTSLESNDYDPSKKYWYYHPWRLDAEQLEDRLCSIAK